ncbi:MAG: PspC domain-containing protein [Lacibacter sp.]
MKKVININFKGRVIPIEEAAFEQLQKYTDSLRRYFANEEGRDEIINDIEDRIAELFDEELKKGATCITEASVSSITSSMGSVEEFEELDNEPGTAGNGNGHSSSKSSATSSAYATADEPRGSLSRNANDKILGGVCSGIAHNLKIDPSIVRILFALITFGGFGAGVLIYIIMWVILPVRDLKTNVRKRLFRSPDEKVVAGVAGGIANYFNIPVWIPRVIFCLPLILGVFSSVFHNMWFDFDFEPRFVFGGFGGTLFLTYVVLWIVLPLASSATDKLQMRGEKIDVNSIKNTVQGEMGSTVKERAAQMSEEIKTGAQKMSTTISEGAQRMGEEISSKSKAFAVEAGPVARNAGNGIGNAIGILFKAFFLFIAIIIAFALLVALFAVTMGGIAVWPLKDFFFEGAGQNFAVWGTLIFFLFVPVIGFFIWTIRRIFGIRSKNSYLGWIFGSLWTIGWICAIILVGSVFKNFRSYERVEQSIPVTQPVAKKMLVKVSEPALRYSGHYSWIDTDEQGWDVNDDTLWISNIKVRIEKSEDSAYSVKTIRYSYGQNRQDAETKAGKIAFNTTYKDSVLDLGNGIAIDKNSKFRGQRVLVVVSVPVGQKIRFDKSLSNKLHPFNVHINRGRNNRYWDEDYDRDYEFDVDMSFQYDQDTDYIMTADGLQRVDGKDKNIKSNDTDQEQIDEEMKNIQEQKSELDKKEQELKQKAKDVDTNRYRYTPASPKAPEKNTKQIVQKLNSASDGPFLPMTVNAL